MYRSGFQNYSRLIIDYLIMTIISLMTRLIMPKGMSVLSLTFTVFLKRFTYLFERDRACTGVGGAEGEEQADSLLSGRTLRSRPEASQILN